MMIKTILCLSVEKAYLKWMLEEEDHMLLPNLQQVKQEKTKNVGDV